MRFFAAINLALSLAFGGVAYAEAEEDLSIADLRRPTMPVADLDASLKFFTEVLNMQDGGRVVYNSPVLRKAIGAPDGVDITVLALNVRPPASVTAQPDGCNGSRECSRHDH